MMMNEEPFLMHNGKKFFQIACAKCQSPNNFLFFYNGLDFILQCSCGHIIEIIRDNVKTEPEPADKKIEKHQCSTNSIIPIQ